MSESVSEVLIFRNTLLVGILLEKICLQFVEMKTTLIFGDYKQSFHCAYEVRE